MTASTTGSAGRWARIRGRPLLLAVLAVVAAALAVPAVWQLSRPTTHSLPLTTVATVALPGQASRFDYADIDAAEHRLFIAHMGDGTLLAVDTRTNVVAA